MLSVTIVSLRNRTLICVKPVCILTSTGVDIKRRLKDLERRAESSCASSEKAHAEQPSLTPKRGSSIALLLGDEESEQANSKDLSSQSIEISEASKVINPFIDYRD